VSSRIHHLITRACAIGFIAASLGSSVFAAEKFAWRPGDSGWIDLLANPDAWKRVSPSPAKFPLAARSPWRFADDRGLLHCDATDIYELFFHEQHWGDGVLHVEWRYLPVPGAAEKNDSGVMFRVSPDRKLALQAQLAGRGLGRIAGDQLRDGARVHVRVGRPDPSLAKPIGEWNTLELTFNGRHVRLVVNGQLTAEMNDLDSPPGRIGLQAEYWPIEFRHVLFKPAPTFP
jgi:Domain of Unknown Function (DUF1080).